MGLSADKKEFHIEVKGATESPVVLLAIESGLSNQKIKLAMQKGAVWVTDNKGTHRLRRKSKKLNQGAIIHFYYDNAVLNEVVENAILVSDEGDYSVWYKPRGMRSQGSKWGDHCAINRWVEGNLMPQRPAFIVHRLDRFASGLILIAHKKKTATLLSNLFKNKCIHKTYKVIVKGSFPDECITYNSQIENKNAISHVSLLEYDKNTDSSLVKVDIETGRKHQIRLHLSNAGFPVIGDRLYGDPESKTDLQLTAYQISFISPIDEQNKSYTLQDELQPKLKNLIG